MSQHAQRARTSKRRCDSAAIDVLEARPRRRTCRQEAKGGQAGLGGMYGGAVPLLIGSSSANAHLSLPVELGRQDDA